jgi:23S rRNA pseudouridine1911/1915/1917 synthase
VEKRYFGIVEGHFPSDRGMIDLPIGLQPGSKIIREINQNGQSAITHYTVIKRLEHYTWMEFTLVTGRTHQIRVHCQASGHPLLGDDLYGGHTQVIQRQALHCHLYSFTHPLHHKQIQVTAPLPHDMFSLIQHH